MKQMSKKELAAILEEHAKWIADPTKGKQAEIVEYEICGENLPYGVIIRDCTVSYCTVSGGKEENQCPQSK